MQRNHLQYTGVDIKAAAEPTTTKCKQTATVRKEPRTRRSSSSITGSMQAPDPQGLRPLLTDPSLHLCLLAEAAQLGCLPGLEAAQLARSPGRKQKPSGESCCVDLGVGGHRHVKVRICPFLFLFFARTPQNNEKKYKKIKHI